MEAAVSLAGLSFGQQRGARVVGLVGVSTERWFQLCVAAVNVVGQHWSSGLRRYVKKPQMFSSRPRRRRVVKLVGVRVGSVAAGLTLEQLLERRRAVTGCCGKALTFLTANTTARTR